MVPHPITASAVDDLRRFELVQTAERERLGHPNLAGRMQPRLAGILAIAAALAIVLIVFTALWLSPAALGAQDASPTAADFPEIAVAFAEAWSSGDPDRLVAVYAEDGIFEEVVLGAAPVQGREQIRAVGEAVFAAFPDFTATPVGGFASGNQAVLEWVLTGTYEGTFGALPPGTGQPVENRVATVLDLTEDGLIAHDREYWDFATLLDQLGLMPGAEVTPEA